MASITFYGGVGSVTGSKYLLDFDGKRVLVELAVVPRRLADRVLAIARALGFKPERLGIAGEDGIDFMRGEQEGDAETPGQSRVARIGLGVGLALLLLLPLLALKFTERREEAQSGVRSNQAQHDLTAPFDYQLPVVE